MLKLLGFFAIAGCLSATAATAQQTRPVVAIYQMEDLAHSGLSDNFSRMLETSITTTSKFRVIERSGLNTLVKEQTRAKAGLVTSNTPQKIGGFEGADYLIYGSITSASLTKKNLFGMKAEPDPNFPTVCLRAFLTLGMDIKITDAGSGEVRYATHIDDTKEVGSACVDGNKLDTTALLRSISDRIATSLVTTIYPIQVASVQPDGVLVLNYGEGTVQPGAFMGIYTKGNAIIDPATGEKLGNDEERIGYVQISAVQGRISRATPVGAFTSAPQIGAIARPASAAEMDALKNNRKKR